MIGELLQTRYELVQELHSDPIFLAFRAKDRVNGRSVQVRVLRDEFHGHSEFVEDLRQSFERMRRVAHPRIERVLGADVHDGALYVVSEHVAGPTVADRLKRLSTFSVPVGLGLAIDVCEALHAVHTAGFAHGDVSARNVIAAPNGTIKLSLPGLWESLPLSPTAGAKMLPDMAPYLAPEVLEGAMPSPASDVYALGILLYECLVGRAPFGGDTPAGIARKHATAPVPSLQHANAAVPTVLDRIVRKAMAKDPAARYPDARAMLEDLRRLQEGLRFGKAVQLKIDDPEDRAIESAVETRRSVVKRFEPQPKSKPKSEPTPIKKVATKVAPAMTALPESERQPRPEPRKIERAIESNDSLPGSLLWAMRFALFLVVLAAGWWLFEFLNRPGTVEVPNIVGMTEEAAEALLEENELVMRRLEVPSEEFAAGTVVEQNPRSGMELKEGNEVEAQISQGSGLVEVPNLVGREVDQAAAMLRQLGLEVERRNATNSTDAQPALTVLEQSPGANSTLRRGETVRVTVNVPTGQAPPPDPVDQPQLYRLELEIPGDPEEMPGVTLRVEITDLDGTRQVYSAFHDPGDTIDVEAMGRGESAQFVVYYDDIEVMSQTLSPTVR